MTEKPVSSNPNLQAIEIFAREKVEKLLEKIPLQALSLAEMMKIDLPTDLLYLAVIHGTLESLSTYAEKNGYIDDLTAIFRERLDQARTPKQSG